MSENQRESYHNYMMRRLKEMWDKEKQSSLMGTNARGEKESLLNYEVPQLRAKIGELQAQIDALKLDNVELTKSYYELLKRITNESNNV